MARYPLGSAPPGQEFRLSTEQMHAYWREHAQQRAEGLTPDDPDALGNVCHPGVPLWLNRHYAAGQRLVFELLLREVPREVDQHALDVGCGGGRWCRRLSEQGYAVTGIDLQPSLVERNQRMHPEMCFLNVSLEDFRPLRRFDLITSVTVLGHIPHEQQPSAIRSLRNALADDGHVLVLENVRDQAPHVFANDLSGWLRLFGEQDLVAQLVVRYDFNPALRLVGALRRLASGRRVETLPSSHPAPGELERFSLPRWGVVAAQRAAVAIDQRLEPGLITRQSRMSSVHAGLLLRAC